MSSGSSRTSETCTEFNDAVPFATQTPFDAIFRAAARLNAAVAQHDDDVRAGICEEGLWSPTTLTPLSSGAVTPCNSNIRTTSTPQDVMDAVAELLDGIDIAENARLASQQPLRHTAPNDAESCSDSSEYGEAQAQAQAQETAARSTGKRKRGDRAGQKARRRERKRLERERADLEGGKEAEESGRERSPDSGPSFNPPRPPNPPGTGRASHGKKKYLKQKRTGNRCDARQNNAESKPYDKQHSKAFFERQRTIKMVNLRTFEVRYATQRGGYTAPSWRVKKVYSVAELNAMGFKELPWDGEDTIALLDSNNRVFCVLLGPPKGLSNDGRKSWEDAMVDLAKTLERLRTEHGEDFGGKHSHHDRGDFAAFAAGFTYSNGKKAPSNLTYANKGHRAVAEELLEDGDMRRLAGFASAALAFYFPLVYQHMCERLQALCEHHPDLAFPFGGTSAYPTVTFNMGPVSVTFGHNDGTNYAGIPCSITALGVFDEKKGGHLILFDLQLYFKFPAGRTVLLSSAGLRHGNTRLASADDRRYSVTQYCQGGLIRWAAYGFRPAGPLTDAQKTAADAEMGESWEAQLGRFSTWESLPLDRQALQEWEKSR